MTFDTDRSYHKASLTVDRYLESHKGETFDLDTICRHLSVTAAHDRDLINQKLNYEARRGVLEKTNRLYRYIDSSLIRMDWRNSVGAINLPLNWPGGIDGSKFGFDGHISIPEKALVVLAGVTNTGKSVFMRNFLWKNMDTHNCIYFSSETSADDFGEYASRMTWANPVSEDGKDKFSLVWRDKDFKDVIEPDAVNIIDWLNIYNEFYRIGEILDGIKNKLNKGIVVLAIQKDPNKGLGVGGMWAEHKASLYMTMDFSRLTIEKAKKWSEFNPNHQSWGFKVVDQGTHFTDIHPLIKCPDCWGTGRVKNIPCANCDGTGWADTRIDSESLL